MSSTGNINLNGISISQAKHTKISSKSHNNCKHINITINNNYQANAQQLSDHGLIGMRWWDENNCEQLQSISLLIMKMRQCVCESHPDPQILIDPICATFVYVLHHYRDKVSTDIACTLWMQYATNFMTELSKFSQSFSVDTYLPSITKHLWLYIQYLHYNGSLPTSASSTQSNGLIHLLQNQIVEYLSVYIHSSLDLMQKTSPAPNKSKKGEILQTQVLKLYNSVLELAIMINDSTNEDDNASNENVWIVFSKTIHAKTENIASFMTNTMRMEMESSRTKQQYPHLVKLYEDHKQRPKSSTSSSSPITSPTQAEDNVHVAVDPNNHNTSRDRLLFGDGKSERKKPTITKPRKAKSVWMVSTRRRRRKRELENLDDTNKSVAKKRKLMWRNTKQLLAQEQHQQRAKSGASSSSGFTSLAEVQSRAAFDDENRKKL